jgi:CIC family chloride channel protein
VIVNRKQTGDLVRLDKPRLLIEAVALGVAGALAARVFTWLLHVSQAFFMGLIAGYSAPTVISEGGILKQLIGPHGLWLIPLATTLGGLVSGILVYALAPEAEGHGTDAAVSAFHRAAGFIRVRVAPVKLIASAITIGSGGSAGREGPIALITAGLGSFYATFFKRSDSERRTLMLAGMAAGLAAIFRTPMGTGVFAIEVLYSDMEFESGVLLYTMLSSAIAYAVNGLFVGWQPLFAVTVATVPKLSEYGWYLALGALAGLVATILPEVFYRTRDAFQKLPVPAWIKPAIGGLGVGLIALKFPQVLGGGYGWIQLAMNGQLELRLLLILVAAKLIALALTVSSGGSGGVFAPSLFVGAMLGGACALVFHQPTAIFVIVGMAAVFGAAARVPVATMLMVTEMAGGYQLLVPAGSAVMLSYLLQTWLSQGFRYRSLYEAQVPLRENSPAHYLDHVRVALTLLGRRDLPAVDKMGHLNLLRLLRSNVRFDLPGGRQLQLCSLLPQSRFIGSSVAQFYKDLDRTDVEIVALVRRKHVVLPHPDTVLNENDHLMFISTEASRTVLGSDIAPLADDHHLSHLS